MKNKNSVREMVISSFTMGLVLPVIFHFFGLGSAFLPMHIPVLLSGFILPTPYAAAVGAITPFLSCILFLASEESSFFTGQVLSPNGGFVI